MNSSLTPILSVSGSDSTGQSGIQADIKTIAALGGYAVTAVSCVTVQDNCGVKQMFDLPADIVVEQAKSIISDVHPKAIKIGLVRDSDAVKRLRNEVIGCSKLVVAPGIYASDGTMIVDESAIVAIACYLIPQATLLMLRCRDAEKVLGISISTDDDMQEAAKRLHEMGAEWVLLRGGQYTQGRLKALLYGNTQYFFSSYNTEGWQRHGVGGALSAAITTRMGMGDDVPTAIRNAHDFIHSQVVYAKNDGDVNQRPVDLYNGFVSLVAEHYTFAHDVAFYADKLCITPRYLSQVTDKVVGKSPKQIIADYLMSEARTYLSTTRLTMQEIADKLGFSSQAMFCRFFKNQSGQSPSENRNSF